MNTAVAPAPATARAITLPAIAAGETYAGVIVEAGAPTHHLILLAGDKSLTWKKALEWAVAQGGDLPTRREQALLFANAPEQFEKDWYWSNEPHASYDDYAWIQYFGNGYQLCSHQGIRYRARAVRRVPIH